MQYFLITSDVKKHMMGQCYQAVPHLSKVPRLVADLLLGADVDASSVVEHVLLTGLVVVQVHLVVCRGTDHKLRGLSVEGYSES